jgi:hypothetical protein
MLEYLNKSNNFSKLIQLLREIFILYKLNNYIFYMVWDHRLDSNYEWFVMLQIQICNLKMKCKI